jgi:23S rRNA (cytosine1962-C5)-methyltransferase
VLATRITGVYDKSVEALPGNYAAQHQNGWLESPAVPVTCPAKVLENGVSFNIDWETGQKTGFFLDQRDNRALLGKYVLHKSVLNTFCYTGGFSAYALRGGARLVHSVDVSGKAMELTAQNIQLNAPFEGQHEGFTEDVLAFLKRSTEQYDVVVVDPPAYAKSIEKRHNAVQGYRRLNVAAIQKVKPGGLLFTFSCSQVVDRALFYNTIVAAALEAGRPARVLHHLTQGPDHPVSLFHPEGAYLKGLVVHLE